MLNMINKLIWGVGGVAELGTQQFLRLIQRLLWIGIEGAAKKLYVHPNGADFTNPLHISLLFNDPEYIVVISCMFYAMLPANYLNHHPDHHTDHHPDHHPTSHPPLPTQPAMVI